jgi:hypothetical protein
MRTIEASSNPVMRMARREDKDKIDYYYSQLLGADWQEQMKQVGAGGTGGAPPRQGRGGVTRRKHVASRGLHSNRAGSPKSRVVCFLASSRTPLTCTIAVTAPLLVTSLPGDLAPRRGSREDRPAAHREQGSTALKFSALTRCVRTPPAGAAADQAGPAHLACPPRPDAPRSCSLGRPTAPPSRPAGPGGRAGRGG